MSHRSHARTALTTLVAAASALTALAAPAAAAQAHDGHHGRHHARRHHAVRHHSAPQEHRRYRGLPAEPFLLRNMATGSCLTAEDRPHYTAYALAECSHHSRYGLWTVDPASGTLRNMGTERCVVPGYAEDFSCARLAEYGHGFAVHRDDEGRISYRSITGLRYLNVAKRISGGYVLGATHSMEAENSEVGREQRWTAETA